MASSSTPSSMEPARTSFLVHKVQLKLIIKVHSTGIMISGIIDVVITSVHCEYTMIVALKLLVAFTSKA